MTFIHLDTIKKIERLSWIAHNKASTGKDEIAEELGARIEWDGKRRLLWPIEVTLIDDKKL
jgi:hypothetical protein